MDLDSKQTRRLYLAGTVAFPTPFPTAGGISIEYGSILPRADGDRERAVFVIVQEKSSLDKATIRVVLKENVAAIFFPGVWVDTDKGRVFQFAERDRVRDFEKGEWFLNPQIDAERISERFCLDIRSRESGARGIAFVPKDRAVLTHTEVTQTARATCHRRRRRGRGRRRSRHLLCDPICRECDPIPCDCIDF